MQQPEKRITPTLTVSQALEAAFTHHSQGNLTEAERLYAAVLGVDADDPDALHLMGVLRKQQGRYDEAISLIGAALERAPDYVEAHVNLGVVLNDVKRYEDAVECYRRALALDPGNVDAHYNSAAVLTTLDRREEAVVSYQRALAINPGHVEAHYNLGIVQNRLKRREEAVASLRRALAIRPDYARAHFTLGGILREQGRLGEAEESYRRAAAINPGYAELHIALGYVLQAQGRLSEAEASFRQVLAIKPDQPAALSNLGAILRGLGRLAEAEASCRRAITINPDIAEVHSNLGNVLLEQGRYPDAEESYRRALVIKPDIPETYSNLGTALQEQGRLTEAEVSHRRALAIRPDHVEAHNGLGIVLLQLGRVAEAEAGFRRALALKPDYSEAHSNLLLALNYTSRLAPAELFEEHLAWARRHEAPQAAQRRPHANTRDSRRRLRVGYVSPDFRGHSVAFFIEPLLARHDRNAFEVYCYSNVMNPDRVTQRLMALADSQRSIVGMSDARAAELVSVDGMDILIDLAGHTARGRLGIFALKPAPVQVSYLGYPNTSGLSSIAWRITDVHADPPGDGDRFHSERLARLPETFLCFRPPDEAPEVELSPFARNGCITFGSFNARQKVTPEVIRTWAQLLERVPGSRLLLKGRGFGDTHGRERLLVEFAQHGIGENRLVLLPRDDGSGAHLSRYHEVDIGLDPFPYNGTTTTCEALWMGLPVVSIAGDRHASRVGASILTNLRLTDLIAQNREEYLALAAALATDRARLAQLRKTMRERVRTSPLCDEEGFTRAVEKAYRQMWARWCGQEAP